MIVSACQMNIVKPWPVGEHVHHQNRSIAILHNSIQHGTQNLLGTLDAALLDLVEG